MTTAETVDLTIKVSIPLVGGKIEGLIADLLLKALKAENARRPRLPARAERPSACAVLRAGVRTITIAEHHERPERQQQGQRLLEGVQRTQVQEASSALSPCTGSGSPSAGRTSP